MHVPSSIRPMSAAALQPYGMALAVVFSAIGALYLVVLLAGRVRRSSYQKKYVAAAPEIKVTQPKSAGSFSHKRHSRHKSPLSAPANIPSVSTPQSEITQAPPSDSESEPDDIVHYLHEAAKRNERIDDQHESAVDTNQNEANKFTFDTASASPGPSQRLTPDIHLHKAERPRNVSDGSSVGDFPCSPDPQLETLLGKIMLSAQYTPEKQRLELTLRDGYNIVVLSSGEPSTVAQCQSYCRVALMPSGRPKFKSQLAAGANPAFHETFVLHNIKQEELHGHDVRIRMYRRFERQHDQLLSEALLPLSLIDARSQQTTSHLLPLNQAQDKPIHLEADTPRTPTRSGSFSSQTGSYCTSPSGRHPSLLVTLCYNDMTGKLILGLDRASTVGVDGKPVDTMVKVTVMSPYGQEIGRSKTSVVAHAGTDAPEFNANFMYQVPHSDVSYVSVLLHVYGYVGIWRRKCLIGWLSLGHNSTGRREADHWKDMVQGMGTSVSKWHSLIVDSAAS